MCCAGPATRARRVSGRVSASCCQVQQAEAERCVHVAAGVQCLDANQANTSLLNTTSFFRVAVANTALQGERAALAGVLRC